MQLKFKTVTEKKTRKQLSEITDICHCWHSITRVKCYWTTPVRSDVIFFGRQLGLRVFLRRQPSWLHAWSSTRRQFLPKIVGLVFRQVLIDKHRVGWLSNGRYRLWDWTLLCEAGPWFYNLWTGRQSAPDPRISFPPLQSGRKRYVLRC